ncbi:MAG: thymidine phosphorylase [Clostridia bacterium]|nr:thymidine phosphorylase [Clostridia bacterium]MDY6183825.1 thymidine phosphorylase [Eubacteriales bacterium]
MRMYDIIKKKRDGGCLSTEEIRAFVAGYTAGEIPDYQAAALAMAIYFRGMDDRETTDLTLAVRDSGERLDFSKIAGIRADKHSTGGVGDKTSLIVAPTVAALGVKVAKMSGRGLGHTGGTVDKLEAFAGFRTDLPKEEFEEIVNRVGVAIVGQTATLAPADKKLYALRDVTATVDSMPLIASSIMGKKLAADDDCIVLDVKTGSGSFMKTEEKSFELARLMVEIGRRAGKKMSALITDMDAPLGRAVGNSLEVIEAIDTLAGHGPADLTALSVALSAEMLYLAGRGSREECERTVKETIASGAALRKLAEMVEAQGGDPAWVMDTAQFPRAAYERKVLAPRAGFITRMDTEALGLTALSLGAGRNTMGDKIDLTAGFYLEKKTGDRVETGEVLATLYTSKEELLDGAERSFLGATSIEDAPPAPRPLILGHID